MIRSKPGPFGSSASLHFQRDQPARHRRRSLRQERRGGRAGTRARGQVSKRLTVRGERTQHTGPARPRQLRAYLPFLFVAVSAAAPLAAQQEQQRVVRGLSFKGNHAIRSEEHTSELQSPYDLVCRLLLEKK